MTHPLAALLFDYALGTLGETERAQLEHALERTPELARELQEIEETFSVMAQALPPAAPDPGRKAILLAALETQSSFSEFLEPLCELFDLGKREVERVLGWIGDPRRWEPGPMPGIEMLRCAPGPKAAAWEVGFIRFAAGLAFPRHRHLGLNTELVMAGEFTDLETGVLHRTGELIVKDEGTEHAFVVSADEPCLLATRFPGIQIL
jgi:anti-sigma factor ChrR (cupin superfamily)